MNKNLVYYNKRTSKIKKRKRRKTVSIIIIASLLLFLSSVIYKTYIEFKCRDLQYAVEHEMTSGCSNERLLRVQHITLLFNDNNNAVAEVSGLSKNKPHYELTIKGTFKKDFLDSWKLIYTERS